MARDPSASLLDQATAAQAADRSARFENDAEDNDEAPEDDGLSEFDDYHPEDVGVSARLMTRRRSARRPRPKCRPQRAAPESADAHEARRNAGKHNGKAKRGGKGKARR